MKAKKILETAKLQDTFWGKIIIASEKRGHFTVHKKELAGDRITCACGKLDNNIPRFSDGDPIDPYLREYGKLFEASVLDCDFAKAAQLLCKIEKRSAKILSENIDEDPLSRY